MSLESWDDRGVPELTARVVRASFPKGTLAVRVREALGRLFEDESFAGAFSTRGRPAVSPGALALVSVLQYAEGHTDRQAADQVRARMDWKFLLGLELDDPGFDFSVLSDFRTRLIEHGLEERVLDLVLERMCDLGLLRSGGRQRTDSTHAAPRGALSYPRFSREKLGGMFLGPMTYLDLKSEGNHSMSGKYRLCSGV